MAAAPLIQRFIGQSQRNLLRWVARHDPIPLHERLQFPVPAVTAVTGEEEL